MKKLLVVILFMFVAACYNDTPCTGEGCFLDPSWLGFADEVEVNKQYKIAITNNANFNINSTDKAGNTAIIYMARNNKHANSVLALIKIGANVNQQNKDGWTALMYAADNNRILEITEVLLKNGANVNLKNSSGEDAITRALKTAGSKNSTKNGLTDISFKIIDLLNKYK